MTCKDCLHYERCKKLGIFNVETLSVCEDFADRSEWVHLLCKVGDKVYYIYQNPTTCKYSIHKREIYLIEFKDNHFYFFATPSICFKDTEFGKSIFLGSEEAEKALKECENNE